MTMRLLVDAAEFWDALARDIAAATRSVYGQMLSFEADAAGIGLMEALLATGAGDRRLLVDSYTKVILNDRFLYWPKNLFDGALRREVRETRALIERGRAGGVDVRFTNPMGFLLRRLPARDHKKILAIDGAIGYIGGLNFSAHNFAWHDLMLRIEDPAAAAFLADDFLATWGGRRDGSRSETFPGIELHTCDGRSNARVFARLFERIDAARERIFVASPYITFPFFEPLERAVRRGVDVVLVSPQENNYTAIKHYITWECARRDIRLRLWSPGMSHLKAMLIDRDALVLGSSNFDALSYELHGEIVGVVTDTNVIRDFEERVMRPDLARSRDATAAASRWLGRLAYHQMRVAARVAALLSA